VTNKRTGELDRPLYPGSVYHNIVLKYGGENGISAEVNGLCVHSLRATAVGERGDRREWYDFGKLYGEQ